MLVMLGAGVLVGSALLAKRGVYGWEIANAAYGYTRQKRPIGPYSFGEE